MSEEQHLRSEKARVIEIVDTYLQTVRKWKAGEYVLTYRGKTSELYKVKGHLLEDEVESEEWHKNNPGKARFGYFPSEFAVWVDLEKGEVVEDFRVREKELHPRP